MRREVSHPGNRSSSVLVWLLSDRERCQTRTRLNARIETRLSRLLFPGHASGCISLQKGKDRLIREISRVIGYVQDP